MLQQIIHAFIIQHLRLQQLSIKDYSVLSKVKDFATLFSVIKEELYQYDIKECAQNFSSKFH